MKTFADFTPQELDQCRGMWVSYQTPMGEEVAIYEAGTTLFEPGYGRFTVPLDKITLRHNLPRAWNKDGTPLSGTWEYRPEYLEAWGEWIPFSHPTTDKSEAEEMANEATQFKNVKTRITRRWVGKWEES